MSLENLPPYIILPRLHECCHGKSGGARLDPGICETASPDVYLPSYPLSPAQARERIERMRGEGLWELETLRHGLDIATDFENLKLQKELAEAALFDGTGRNLNPREDELDLEMAQEWLLRIWLMEDSALEISRLEAMCRRVDQSLADSFGEGPGEAREIQPALDPALLPPWRVCAKNAMYFCPPELPVLVEGDMERDLAENFQFMPFGEAGWSFGEELLALESPLWKILGRGTPVKGSGTKAEVFNCPRIWLRRAKDCQ